MAYMIFSSNGIIVKVGVHIYVFSYDEWKRHAAKYLKIVEATVKVSKTSGRKN